MPINTIATATLFQRNLDQLAVEEALTGWMDANAGQVQYNGGAEVKIPKLSVNGLGDYDRDNGYVQGGVTLTYGTYEMTQDRGRKFQLDAMDVDESNFVATASNVMGEFQRTKVVPEIDAYRLSKIITKAIAASNVEYGYTPAAATVVSKMKAAMAAISEEYSGQLICHASPDTVLALEEAAYGKLESVTFSNGGIDTTVPALDTMPIIKTPANRMYSAITTYDGSTSGQTAGGYIKNASTGKDCNFVIMAVEAPIAVTKQDKMKIFTPDQNQDADAWKMNYRRFHDLWVLDNKVNLLYANIKQAASA